jgi:hypothetical protein
MLWYEKLLLRCPNCKSYLGYDLEEKGKNFNYRTRKKYKCCDFISDWHLHPRVEFKKVGEKNFMRRNLKEGWIEVFKEREQLSF